MLICNIEFLLAPRKLNDAIKTESAARIAAKVPKMLLMVSVEASLLETIEIQY